MNPYYFKFSQLPGDLIHFLAGIKHVCERDDRKAVIMLGLDIQWQSPWAGTRQQPATLTQNTLDMLKPLLMSQDYIEDVISWEGADPKGYKIWVDFFKMVRTPSEMMTFSNQFNHLVDLDKIYLVPTTLPNGNIHRWPWYCYPDMACNLAEPWLFVEPDDLMADLIVVNRTLRARNNNISYKFLKPFDKNLVFVGFDDEFEDFVTSNGLIDDELIYEDDSDAPGELATHVQHFKPNDFHELATLIRSAKLFIGNQSLCFALAEAMKVPRVLEVCPQMPCVVPSGDNAYDAMFTSTMEYYFKELNK